MQGSYEQSSLIRRGGNAVIRANQIHRLLGIRGLLLFGVALIASSGCSVGPKYRKPAVPIPDAYRGAAAPETNSKEQLSFGDQKWMEVFPDEQLQKLIQTALQQNFDVRIAAARILQAEAQAGITRADQLPTVAGTAQISTQGNPKSFFPQFSSSQGGMGLAAAWELDFWGKYRHATEAARANILINQWAKRAVASTLVANLAGLLLSSSRTGSRTGDFPTNAGFSPGIASTQPRPGNARAHLYG
jgi:hypothetical protein